ncbi:PST-A protein [Plasmodium vivax Brazil I]|nr:PST-A protein [Plasmodium vivax Brazil I]
MRGHGQSGCVQNVKTHINDFHDLVYDVLEYANIVYDSLCTGGKKKKKKSPSGGVNTSSDTAPSGGLSSSASSSDDDDTSQGSRTSSGNAPPSGANSVRRSDANSMKRSDANNMRRSDANNMRRSDANNMRRSDVPPFFLMGLSMGGNIVLRILELGGKKGDESIKRLNIKGVISLAGMISLDDLKKKPEYKYFYIPMGKLASMVLPTMRMTPSLNFKMFPFINDLFSFDAHCYPKPVTNRFGSELLKAVDALRNDVKFIPEEAQILLVHSVLDSACSYNGVLKFFKSIQTKNKELFTIEDMDHILPLEPGNERILKKVIDWLAQLQCVRG